jgi:hypothetical protein
MDIVLPIGTFGECKYDNDDVGHVIGGRNFFVVVFHLHLIKHSLQRNEKEC